MKFFKTLGTLYLADKLLGSGSKKEDSESSKSSSSESDMSGIFIFIIVLLAFFVVLDYVIAFIKSLVQ